MNNLEFKAFAKLRILVTHKKLKKHTMLINNSKKIMED
jgi:hypothetical protein